MRTNSGFSVLEALVAVAIVAIALIPLTGLQMQIVRSQARHLEDAERATTIRNAVEFMRAVNPTRTPEGAAALGEGLTLRWNAEPISPPRPSVNAPGYTVQLFRVEVEAAGPRASYTFSMEQLGWREQGSD